MVSNDRLQKYLSWLLAVFGFLALFLNYTSNAFGIVDMGWFNDWQLDSEGLVTRSLQKAIDNGIGYEYGLLDNYPQQIGLQGMFFRVIDLILNRTTVPVGFLHNLTVFILCTILFVFLYWAKREFGLFSAVIGFIVLFFNKWMIVTARNLYWVTFTQLLPFLSILLLARRTEKTVEGYLFGIVAFITIFIKTACGFEMISSVMIAMEVPIFYYAYKDRWEWKIFLKIFFICGLGALLGFLAAMGINFLQQTGYWGSASDALDHFMYTISKRTGMFSSIKVDDSYTASLEAGKWSVLKTYLLSGSPLIGDLHMISILFIAGIATALSFMGKEYCAGIWADRRKLHGLCIATWVSFLGPASWYILASPHSYIHTTINYFLWSFPCILLVSVLCGSMISRSYVDHRTAANKVAVCSTAVCFVLVTYFYVDSCKVGRTYLKQVQEDGKQIENGRYADLYYYDENLYYLIPKNHVGERIFLHLYTAEGSAEFANEWGFVNRDFAFADRELKTPFWEETKIARIPLDMDYSISDVETGQFTGTGREWETSFSLADYIEMPSQIVPDSLTDGNWTNGVMANGGTEYGTRLLMKAENELTLHLLEGRTLRSESGKTVYVKQVLKQGDWIHLILDGTVDASDGYPHAFYVVGD